MIVICSILHFNVNHHVINVLQHFPTRKSVLQHCLICSSRETGKFVSDSEICFKKIKICLLSLVSTLKGQNWPTKSI